MSVTLNSGGEVAHDDSAANAAIIFGAGIDDRLKSLYGIDPARLNRALEEAGNSSARARLEAVEQLVRPELEPEDDHPLDPLSEAVCRHFGLGPAEVRAFNEQLHAQPQTRHMLPGGGTKPAYQPPTKIAFESPDPWPELVTAGELVPALITAIRAHISISGHGALLAALWVLHTHALDAFATSPRLVIRSAHPACGKSRLILILSCLVPNPLQLCAAAPRALLDTLGFTPALLIDDAPRLLRNPTIATVLRNGRQRIAASLLRSAGKETQSVPVFTPAAIAIHGKMPPLLAGRSIELRLEPKKSGDQIRTFTGDSADELKNLCRMAARWAQDNVPRLRQRQANWAPGADDNWTPLSIIAEDAGGEWDKRVAELIAHARAESGSPLRLLLADIREILRQRKAGDIILRGPNGAWLIDRDRIRSSDLASLLAGLEGQPWNEWGRTASAITPHHLAVILADAEVRPINLRFNLRDQIGHESSTVAKGYSYEHLENAFARHLDGAAAPNNAA
jgi:hypothetical protein